MPLSGDPNITQLQQALTTFQQFITSPQNLIDILSSSGIFNLGFLVYLQQSGGANGDDGSTTTKAFPTYTYDLYTDSGHTNLLQTATSVLFHRPLQIAVHAATHGFAVQVGGTYLLLVTDEYFDDEILTFDVA
jgi:hypothetical protein